MNNPSRIEVGTPMRHKFAYLLLAFLILTSVSSAAQKTSGKKIYRVYVGTYTEHDSKGIYAFQFDSSSGKAGAVELVAETKNPSFLAIEPKHRYIFSANEISEYQGKKSGGISAFAVEPGSGKLTFLNEVSSGGAGPCQLAVDKTGKYVVVANYDSGSIAAFPVQSDGKLAEASSVVQHTGHGPDADRQKGPHAHNIAIAPDNRFVIANDLGLDQLLVYHFNATKGTLTANQPPFASVEPGAGPRHAAFHPNGRFVYSINEMAGSVSAFRYDAKAGSMQHLQTISSLPPGYKGAIESAEITAHPSGKFLYASNRGDADTIAVFAIDNSGMLKMIESAPTIGKTPRNFAIDPTGQFLLVAGQNSNNVVVFRIDPKTGRLTATGQVVDVPMPVCLIFLPIN